MKKKILTEQQTKKNNIRKLNRPEKILQVNEIKPSERHDNVFASKDTVDFHIYRNPNEINSPMYLSEAQMSPGMYPNKMNKIRTMKANIQNSNLPKKGDMQYDNFFHLRNSPKNAQLRKIKEFSSCERELSHKSPSGRTSAGIEMMYSN